MNLNMNFNTNLCKIEYYKYFRQLNLVLVVATPDHHVHNMYTKTSLPSDLKMAVLS